MKTDLHLKNMVLNKEWQALICTISFFVLFSLPVIFKMIDWYGIITVFIASFPCYLVCYIGVSIGRKVSKRQHIGGFLGGLAGILVYLILLVAIFFCLMRFFSK